MILESWNSCTWVMMLKKKIKINITRGAILTILSNRTWNGKVYLDLRNSHHRSVAHMTQVQEPERQKFTLSRHTCVFCYWNFKKQTQIVMWCSIFRSHTFYDLRFQCSTLVPETENCFVSTGLVTFRFLFSVLQCLALVSSQSLALA